MNVLAHRIISVCCKYFVWVLWGGGFPSLWLQTHCAQCLQQLPSAFSCCPPLKYLSNTPCSFAWCMGWWHPSTGFWGCTTKMHTKHTRHAASFPFLHHNSCCPPNFLCYPQAAQMDKNCSQQQQLVIYFAQCGLVKALMGWGGAEEHKGSALGHGDAKHSTEECRHGRALGWKQLPMQTETWTHLALGTTKGTKKSYLHKYKATYRINLGVM